MSMATLGSIVVPALLMLLLIIIILLLVWKPWRFCFRSPLTRPSNVGDLKRPLVSEDPELVENHTDDSLRHSDLEGYCSADDSARHSCLEGSSIQSEGYGLHQTQGLVYKQRLSTATPNLVKGESFILDVDPEPSEDVLVGQTLKRPLKNYLSEQIKSSGKEELTENIFLEFLPKNFADRRSCLTLKVISGPSCGLQYSVQSTNTSRLPLILGRVSPSVLLLKDSEVSGKHARITWNLNKLKWELLDLGSLNGTLLNSQAVHHPDSGSRHWGSPAELANGDTITLGSTSKIYVQITSQAESHVPFRFGFAAEPMALRRGGRKLPMEDVCFSQWPLQGIGQFGLFGICDGHGGAEAAKLASKMLPEMVARILSDSKRRDRVLSLYDASDVLKDAFSQTETFLNHQYEGCTATVLLVWAHEQDNFFVQCANVGDSACVVYMDGEQTVLTEDHRISSYSERLRISRTGQPLKDGETRLFGINLARMLGDKFLKEQDTRFSSDPFISRVLHIDQASRAFALLASDGLWDVVSIRKAVQLVLQKRESCAADEGSPAERIAYILLSEAMKQRTKDNTSIIFIDFDTSALDSSCKSP